MMDAELFRSASNPFQLGLAPQAKGPFNEAIAKGSQLARDTFFPWQRELADFATKRVQAILDLQAQLSSCKNVYEVGRVELEWAGKEAQAYLEEAGKLAELGMKLARAGTGSSS